MAVGPFRTLLEAHLQATWNRSRHELGKTGHLVLVLTMAVLILCAALPMMGGGLVGGFLMGRNLEERTVVLFLGGILLFLSAAGGIVGGISGGSRVLAWESYLVFPLRLRSLFLAELVAGLGDLLPLFFSLVAACLLLGVGIARPRLLPLLPLLCIGTVAALLCLQHLVGSLAARIVKHLRAGLVLLGVLVWLSTIFLGPVRSAPATSSRAQVSVEQELRIQKGLHKVVLFAQYLPPMQAALGLQDAMEGRWTKALGRQAFALAMLALLLVVTAGTLKREVTMPNLRVVAPRNAKERLWSFSTPVAGLARLHWQTLLSSHLGKFGFLIPLVSIVVLKGLLAHGKSSHLWAVPVAFAYLSLTGMQMQLSQFGLDGPGIKTLLLLPLRGRDLLLGKFWGLACYHGIQAILLLLFLLIGTEVQPLRVFAGLCLAGCLFIVQTGLGHWTSAWMPRPMPRDSLKNANQAQPVVWIGIAASTTGSSLFGGTFALTSWLAPALLLPVMATLLGLTALLYRYAILPATARYLDRRRETLVLALG